jgi:hypothetical protein
MGVALSDIGGVRGSSPRRWRRSAAATSHPERAFAGAERCDIPCLRGKAARGSTFALMSSARVARAAKPQALEETPQ